MKNIYLAGIIAAALVFTGTVFVYAHGMDSGMINDDNHYYNANEMNELHNQMMDEIDDPQFVDAMNAMHNGCIEDYEENMMDNYRGMM